MNKPFYNIEVTEKEVADMKRYVELLVTLKHDVSLLTKQAIADGKLTHMKSAQEFVDGHFRVDSTCFITILLVNSVGEELYITFFNNDWEIEYKSGDIEVKIKLDKLPNFTYEMFDEFTYIDGARADSVLSSVYNLDEIAKLRNKIVLNISTSISNKLDELGIQHEKVEFNTFCGHLLTPTAVLPDGETIIFECTQDGKEIVSMDDKYNIRMPLVLPEHECLKKGILRGTLATIVNMPKLLPSSATPLQTRQYLEDIFEQAELSEEVGTLTYV